MTTRVLAAAVLALAWAVPARAALDVKVKIEGTPADQEKLLERLNDNGKKDGMNFVRADADYQFRIAVYSEGTKAVDFLTGGGADAAAAVLNPACEMLFIVSRGDRGTKGGAMNALSKEIIKKLPAHLK
jgi:hypothetical protein